MDALADSGGLLGFPMEEHEIGLQYNSVKTTS